MILTYRLKHKVLWAIVIVGYFVSAYTALAQSSVTLSVIPPLIQNAVDPGDVWQSQVKVVNPNPFPITVYADVVHFSPRGEEGQGTFHPVVNDPSGGTSLPHWITITRQPLLIEREQSRVIPFTIDVPEDAPPGGHYAAIFIGTKPPESEEQVLIQTSQVVTTLFFLQINGDVNELGSIREFRTTSSLLATPETEFILRFENKGNVHLQPQGDIVITNMWGKQRGFIPVNQKTQYGNVLPDSVRKYTFTWKGEPSLADIGRYRAVTTLGYGSQSKHFVFSETIFWVIPIKATLITMGALLALGWFVMFAIRLYIRRMLQMAGVDMVVSPSVKPTVAKESRTTTQKTAVSSVRRIYRHASVYVGSVYTFLRLLVRPIGHALRDLLRQLRDTHALFESMHTVGSFIYQYRVFFGASIGGVVLFVLLVYIIHEQTVDEKSFEVSIQANNQAITLSSEEIKKDAIEAASTEPRIVGGAPKLAATTTQPFSLQVVNASGYPGLAATVAISLEEASYLIDDLATDPTRAETRTVIVYNADYLDQALAISAVLGGVLISAHGGEEASDVPIITVYVGSDQLTDE